MIQQRAYRRAITSALRSPWALLPLVLLLLTTSLRPASGQTGLTLLDNVELTLTAGAVLTLNSSLNIGTNASLTQNADGAISVTGDWTNHGTFNAGSGSVAFVSSGTQTIGGSATTTFNEWFVDKDNSADIVAIDGNVTVAGDLALTTGTLRFVNNGPQTLTVDGDLSVSANSSLDVDAAAGPQSHTLDVSGDIVNNNIIDLNSGTGNVCNTIFSGTENAVVTGASLSTEFNFITMNKAAISDTVRMEPLALSVPAGGFLTLDGGLLHLAGSYALATEFFVNPSFNIAANAGLWIDNPNVSVSGQNGSGTLAGILKVSDGVFTVGTGANENNLLYDDGAELILEDGEININARFSRDGDNNSAISYTQTGGDFSVGVGARNTNGARGIFDIGAAASTFNWSDGSIVLQRIVDGANSRVELINEASNGVVSGGTLRIDNLDASNSRYDLNSAPDIGELLMLGANRARVRLITNDLRVLGDVTIAGTGGNRLIANGRDLTIGGDWFNNGNNANSFNAGSGTVIFDGGGLQTIGGSNNNPTAFNDLFIDQSVNDSLRLAADAIVNGDLRMLSNSIFDIVSYDLTIGESGGLYSDNGVAQNFDINKHIYSDQATGSGNLIYNIAAGAGTPLDLTFPLGTPGVYTPGEISFLTGGATFAAGAFVQMKAVPEEHPGVELADVSLRKYWVVTSGNLTLNPRGANVQFYYNGSEVAGSEGNYVVLYFSPSSPDPDGFWQVDPGEADDVVQFNFKLFYSQEVNSFNGDWTAGEEAAGIATYYSRQDGPYEDPNTWSRVTFGGPASPTAPNKQSDFVYIRDNVVTVGTLIAPVRLLELRANSELQILGNYFISGDTTRIQDNSVFSNGNDDGIAAVGSVGAIQTTVRDLSANVVYKYIGTNSQQITGDGIPSPLRSLFVAKAAGDTLTLSKQLAINDSLVLNNGILDLDAHTLNGNSSGRTFTMRGGELIVRNTFPTNYVPMSFTTGTITFGGSGNQTIPSSASNPAVLQYHRLKINGDRSSTASITFRSQGAIRIADEFDISELRFLGTPSSRFLTDGSTVVFNGSGDQNIPAHPASPADPVVDIPYYNLTLTTGGTKRLSSTIATTFVVLNNLSIESGTSFAANGFDLELRGNWENAGGIFTPGANTVVFRSPDLSFTNTVLSRDVNENPFNNVAITGDGNVQPLDDIVINGNLSIGTSSNLVLTTSTLTLSGNWTNTGGSFSAGTSLVEFSGSVAQKITVLGDSETFYDLTIDNAGGLNGTGVGISTNNGIIVNNTLALNAGNLGVRGRHATVLGSVSRPGGSPGHIDGELRKSVATNAVVVLYEVGYGESYTPIEVEFSGSGGGAGLLSVYSDTVSASSAPVSEGILPAAHQMDDATHVRRQWRLSKPTGSSFSIGVDRKYDVTATFINGVAPNGDLRNGADPLLFEARLWDGAAWILPNRFNAPMQGPRTNTTTQFMQLSELGTLIVGEPDFYSFYSIVDGGNWSTPASWSTQGYGGNPVNIAPTNDANVYVGDDKTIVLDVNYTANGVVTIDSSGVLLSQTNVISGTGEFNLGAFGTLGIGNAGGIRAVANSGTIQTSTRNYNPASHNQGHFIYTDGESGQITGDGLPATVATLVINKTGGSDVSLDNTVAVNDACVVQSGEFRMSAVLTMLGDLSVVTGATFTPQTQTVQFTGSTTQTIFSPGATLTFNNLTIDKAIDTGNTELGTNSNISVNGSLTFSVGNNATLDARNNTNAYVSIAGSVSRLGLGHVDGELRKNIPTGSQTILFEVGEGTNYTPYTIALAGSGGVAGMVSLINKPGRHPQLILASSPIDPSRYIPRFWRLVRPAASAFDRGNRTATVTLQLVAPDDAGLVDAVACCDMSFYRGATEEWQPLYPNSVGSNYTAPFSCGDSRLTLGSIDYDGSANSVIANSIPSGFTFGTSATLSSGGLLLGDFVAGNQNSITITSFYSRANGDWRDPNTWSTTAYAGPPAARYPNTQYDLVFIGDDKTVDLDANIGTSWLYGSSTANAFYGPATTVEISGRLNTGPFEMRGVALTVEKGGTLGIGSHEGITSGFTGNGNVLTYTRSYEDSCRVVYTGEGFTASHGGDFTYCRPGFSAGTYYIDRFRLQEGTSGPILMDNQSSNFGGGIFYYADSLIVLEAGQSYRILGDPSTTGGGTKYWRVYIDFDRDGSLTDGGSQVVSVTGSGSVTSGLFTVPAGTNPGVTRMRVNMRRFSSAGACNGGTGEAEDYTVLIVNNTPQITQATGNGLPDNLWSLEVNSTRSTASVVNLGKNINVKDSVLITRGFFQAGSNDIELHGDFVNNFATNGFDAGTGEVLCIGDNDQQIRGSALTEFNDISLNKGLGTVTVSTSARIDGSLVFDQDNLLVLSSNISLTLSANGSLSAGAGSFSKDRMIQSGGTTDAGFLTKEFTTAAGAKSFDYPLGVDTIYNPASISITGSYAGTPFIGVQLHEGLHPQRLQDIMLKKYWTVTTGGISNISANALQFTYADEDTTGDPSEYIPAFYESGSGWEINVGVNPKAAPSPIEVVDAPNVNGDWTAGENLVFFDGRIFYSRSTGDWNNPDNWSNIDHNGIAASYYPFELYDQDTVIIDGHIITMNVDSVRVDSLRIGGPFAGTEPLGRGILNFDSSPLSKNFYVDRALHVDDDGRIEGETPGGRRDTITLNGYIRNESSAGNSAGVFLHAGANDYTVLRFAGSSNSTIRSEGVWGDIGPVIVEKDDGLADSLINYSSSFAGATGRVAAYHYFPQSGILQQAATGATLSLSFGSNTVTMNPSTGFDIRQGSLRSSSSLLSNVNTSIRLNGGNFYIGDEADEHFDYKSGTSLLVEEGEMNIAGCFSRAEATSTIDLMQSTNGLIRVLAEGNTDVSRIGFDISNSASRFEMTGGRIIIGTGTAGAVSDYRVNAGSGPGMTGGFIQVGDSTITTPLTTMKVAGTLPVWNMQTVGTSATTQITEETFVVLNDLIIDDAHDFQLRGNTLELAGNISNYGSFDATSGSVAVDARLLVANGSGDQFVFNEDPGGLELYNFRMDKSGGNLILTTSGNSSLTVRSTLEFANNNTALIDARSGGHFVEHSPSGGSTPQMIRNGLGHIDGRLFRYIGSGAQLKDYPIGTSASVSGYTPAIFETVGSGGTGGLVGIVAYGNDHPEITAANVSSATNIQRYWNVTTSGAFALGAGRSFKLTTQFRNPDDLRNSPDLAFFQHHRYTPACPDPPAACPPGTGSWTSLFTPDRTDSSLTSTENAEFGDFIMGELDGVPFYSRANGDWDDVNTWSLTGYGGGVAPRIPDQSTDIVRIGNGRRVTLPSSIITPEVRSVTVEVFAGLPGELYIEGDLGTVRGISFVLEDSCTLAMHHIQGIVPTGDKGAVQTDSRIFGVSRYVYNSSIGSQNTGAALPDSIAALIVDIPSLPNNTAFVSNPSGAPSLKIRDTINVDRGILDCGHRDIVLYGDMIMRNNGAFSPLDARVTLLSPTQSYLRLDNISGIDFNDLSIAGSDVLVNGSLVGASTANIAVASSLTFATSAIINVRDFGRRVEIETGATVLRPLAVGYVDGTMRKPFGSGAESVLFEIGEGSDYTPVTVNLDAGGGSGSAGSVDGISYSPVPDEPFVGNRLDPNARVDRYWSVTGATTFAMGGRTANLQFGMPAGDLASLSTGNSVIRRRSIPVEVPEWSERRILEWNTGLASVLLAAGETPWPGLGEFFIGEKAKRIFYSRANGDWDDNTSWSFGGFGGPSVPAGQFPNPDWNLGAGNEYEVRDSVIIGGGFEITLNTQPELASIEISTTGTLLVPDGNFVSRSSLGVSAMRIVDGGTLNNASAEGIELEAVGTGILRFDDAERTFEPRANYIFSGALDQVFGGAFPTQANDITINNDNNSRIVLLNRSGIVLGGALSIQQGILTFDNNDYSGSPADQSLTVNSDLVIATGATFTVELTGTNPRSHSLILGGNVQNNGGNWLMRPTANSSDFKAEVTFNSTATQTISGTAGVNRLHGVTLDKGAATSAVESSVDIGISRVGNGDAITYANGTWRQASGTMTFDDGVGAPRGQTITSNGALHVTGDASLLMGQGGVGASMTLDGGEFLLNTSGAATIGSADGNSLLYTNTANNRLTVRNGTLTVAGRISRDASTGNRRLAYVQEGGSVIAGAISHTVADLGTFDLSASGSSFTMTDGTLLLRNANGSGAGTRPADLDIGASTVAVSGGTIQFGDGATGTPQLFDYEVTNGPVWNVTVGSSNASVHPFGTSTKLRIQGDLSNEGIFDARQIRDGSPAGSSTITFQGSGNSNQEVSGSGTTSVQNLDMNRGGGTGVVELLMDLTVAGTLDLREGSNANDQIIELGDNIDLYATEGSPNSIRNEGSNSGPFRYIRTSQTSGSLIRTIASSGNNFLYPVGSFDGGVNNYTPANFDPTSNGSTGTIAVRVSRGSGAGGGHAHLSGSAADYLQRYWAVSDVTSDRPGRWTFNYLEGAQHITGSEANLATIGRYRPVNETAGGSWLRVAGTINTGANFFESPGGFLAADYEGDWTIGDPGAFRRLFYSLANGIWSDNLTWTFDPSHSGSPVGVGIYPDDPQDSVIIGGGNAGVNNHVVTLDISPAVGGVSLGTALANTGTLDCGVNNLLSDWFVMATSSTLRIGSALGISAAPALSGNIRSTNRLYSTEASYVYNGTTNQITGDGLPTTVLDFSVNNSGGGGNNVVTLGRNTVVNGTMSLLSGFYDMQTYSMTNGTASGSVNLAADTRLQLGGSNNLSLALPAYAAYTIDLDNTVEYYSGPQQITAAPNAGVGYGQVLVNNPGIKTVSSPVLVRGDLTVANGATLQNNPAVNALEVLGSVYNDATVNNDGVIIIGN